LKTIVSNVYKNASFAKWVPLVLRTASGIGRKVMRQLVWIVVFGFIAKLSWVTLSAQQIPQTVYVYTMGTADQNIMMASLEGIVNRSTSGEMMLSPTASILPNPIFWLNELKAVYPQVQVVSQSNPTFLINRYRSLLKGYVLYDRSVNTNSINIATSIAGITNALLVDPATLSYATAAGLPEIADTRNMTYSQAYTQYNSQFNRDMIFYQDPAFNEPLRDYCIMNHGFMFYADPTALNPYAANQNHQGQLLGWGPSEYDLFNQGSQNNQQVSGANYLWSESATSKWRVPLAKQKYHTPLNIPTETNMHYVAFVMTDGDNIQVLTGGWATDPSWFGSPYRGNFNMTWELTSSLAEVNPVAFNYYYEHAAYGSNNDCFVSPGGKGLTFPSQYPDINGLADSISQSLQVADQKVLVIVDPSYDTNALYRILDEPNIMGIMFKTYDDYYKGRDGKLDWHNGKPILSAKYALWDGADTAQSIANSLNADPHRDGLHDSASYSIVVVHAWSTLGPTGTGSGNPMSNLNQLTQWLDPTKVKVVTLEELMVHLRNNFGTPLDFRFAMNADNMTVSNNVFYGQLIGPPGRNAVVEGSTNLQTWTPLQTNTLPPEGFGISAPLSASRVEYFRAHLLP
jgi:hypothetical protein